MALCPFCNGKVQFLADGWVCTECGQQGPPDRIADNWEHGQTIKAPYIKRKNNAD